MRHLRQHRPRLPTRHPFHQPPGFSAPILASMSTRCRCGRGPGSASRPSTRRPSCSVAASTPCPPTAPAYCVTPTRPVRHPEPRCSIPTAGYSHSSPVSATRHGLTTAVTFATSGHAGCIKRSQSVQQILCLSILGTVNGSSHRCPATARTSLRTFSGAVSSTTKPSPPTTIGYQHVDHRSTTEHRPHHYTELGARRTPGPLGRNKRRRSLGQRPLRP